MSSESAARSVAVSRGDPRVFERAFADAPDLGELSYAARRLLSASASLFFRNGAAATSIRDITSACGLTPGAFYKHFDSKDELLYVLVQHGHERLERRIGDAMDESADGPLPQTAAFVRAYVTGHLVNPELAQVIRREYLHLSHRRYTEIVRRRRQLRQRLADLLRRGSDAGVFDLIDGPDGATRVAVMMLDMCSRTSEWYDPQRAEPPHRLAQRYVVAALRLAGASG
ncbi:MAG TPA: TetR/AcrR family transcriptional regulator [Jatrophihabitans sp.]|nr:TetR/AcrR family transcriptional regulator [Jatrophihabitans sp.]